MSWQAGQTKSRRGAFGQWWWYCCCQRRSIACTYILVTIFCTKLGFIRAPSRATLCFNGHYCSCSRCWWWRRWWWHEGRARYNTVPNERLNVEEVIKFHIYGCLYYKIETAEYIFILKKSKCIFLVNYWLINVELKVFMATLCIQWKWKKAASGNYT